MYTWANTYLAIKNKYLGLLENRNFEYARSCYKGLPCREGGGHERSLTHSFRKTTVMLVRGGTGSCQLEPPRWEAHPSPAPRRIRRGPREGSLRFFIMRTKWSEDDCCVCEWGPGFKVFLKNGSNLVKISQPFKTRTVNLVSWLRAYLRVSYSPVKKQIDYFQPNVLFHIINYLYLLG